MQPLHGEHDPGPDGQYVQIIQVTHWGRIFQGKKFFSTKKDEKNFFAEFFYKIKKIANFFEPTMGQGTWKGVVFG